MNRLPLHAFTLAIAFHLVAVPAFAASPTLDARYQAQIQEAYRMVYRGAETGDPDLMARGQAQLQAILVQLEAALKAHPRDARLKDLLRSVTHQSGASGALDDASLDALEKQLLAP